LFTAAALGAIALASMATRVADGSEANENSPVETRARYSYAILLRDLIGPIGGMIGAIGGALSLREYWKNRKPSLRLFVLSWFTALNGPDKKPVLGILLRISNNSRKSAFLCWETISIELRERDRWRKLGAGDFDTRATFEIDFDEDTKSRLGIGRAPFIDRFGDMSVTYDKPLWGWIMAMCERSDLTEGATTPLRIRVQDCHAQEYLLRADLPQGAGWRAPNGRG